MAQLGTSSQLIADGIFLLFVAGIPLYGALKGEPVYDSFVQGARGGVRIMVKIVPYLIAMVVAIGMFRASGGFELIAKVLDPLLSKVGFPTEVLPLGLMRPFSGSASNSLLAEIANQYGGDSLLAQIAATMVGSTETTFYVLAVYFGAVAIRKVRYAVLVGLLADLTGILAAVWICRWFYH